MTELGEEIAYTHFCNLGALCNPGCWSRFDARANRMRYYYQGLLSEACWMGWRKTSPNASVEARQKF